jgi:apolipoprotein N-acyltransferase
MPLIGVYGVGGVVVFISAMLVQAPWHRLRAARPTLMPVLVILVVAAGAGRIEWTTPEGEPIRVALVQTNIDQGLKWAPEMLDEWLTINARLAGGHDADLVVLPETSLPVLVEYLPAGYLDFLEEQALKRNGDLVVGVFSRDSRGQIFNAAISRGVSPDQFYAKNHLVPFGEYSPPLFGWFYTLADIPMSDQTPGDKVQAPMQLGEQRIAINICYEDLFGRALLRTLPEATLMLNISNLAWYGHSLAQPQHLQIARVRALETGRPMLRSTNTGMTALVMPDASVAAVLPQFERGVLEVEVSGYVGMTPYARVGDWLAAAMAVLAILMGWAMRRRA